MCRTSRKALEDKSLDAVSVATCNHWHSLITIWACQAGKHVYVEKPISHNVFEGRKCVEAAQRYNRIVQHGTQQRSDAQPRAADGRDPLGQVRQAAGVQRLLLQTPLVDRLQTVDASRPRISTSTCGSVRHRCSRITTNLHPYNWHWFWDFGNGDTGNQGVHEMDVARWAIPNATLPTKVWSLGGRFVPEGRDQGQTPNMQLSVYEFGETLLVFETRGLVDKPGAPPFKVGNEFYTTDGVIRVDTWEVDGKSVTDFRFHPKSGGEPERLTGGEAEVTPGGPFGAFVEAVRSGDPAKNNCDAEVAHYSAALCHLGNIAYRLSQPLQFQHYPQLVNNQPQIAESLAGARRKPQEREDPTGGVQHLAVRSGTEKFVNDEQANSLLTRWYRAPFVVPETGVAAAPEANAAMA